MGYYSDVKLVTTARGIEKLRENLKSADTDLEEWADRLVCSNSTDAVLAVWEDCKWYSEFPEVEAFHDTLRQLKKADIPYRYVRVGENLEEGDVDTEYSDWNQKLPAIYPDAGITVENFSGSEMYFNDMQAMCDAVLQVCRTVGYGRLVSRIEYDPKAVDKPVKVYGRDGMSYRCGASPEKILHDIRQHYEVRQILERAVNEN